MAAISICCSAGRSQPGLRSWTHWVGMRFVDASPFRRSQPGQSRNAGRRGLPMNRDRLYFFSATEGITGVARNDHGDKTDTRRHHRRQPEGRMGRSVVCTSHPEHRDNRAPRGLHGTLRHRPRVRAEAERRARLPRSQGPTGEQRHRRRISCRPCAPALSDHAGRNQRRQTRLHGVAAGAQQHGSTEASLMPPRRPA